MQKMKMKNKGPKIYPCSTPHWIEPLDIASRWQHWENWEKIVNLQISYLRIKNLVGRLNIFLQCLNIAAIGLPYLDEEV